MRSLSPCTVGSVVALVSRRIDEDGGVRDTLCIEARGVRSLSGGVNAFVVPVPLNTDAGDLTRGNVLSSVYWAPVLKSAFAQTMMPHCKAGKAVSGVHSSVAYERLRETVVIVANSIEEFEREINKVPEAQRPEVDYAALEEFWSTYPRHAMAFALFGKKGKKESTGAEIVRLSLWFHTQDHHNIFVPTAIGAIDEDVPGNADVAYTVMIGVSDMAEDKGMPIDYPEDLSPEVRKLAPAKVISETFASIKAIDDLVLRIEDASEGKFNAIFHPALSRRTQIWKRPSVTAAPAVQTEQSAPVLFKVKRPSEMNYA